MLAKREYNTNGGAVNTDKQKLIKRLNKHFEINEYYTFRPVIIDGINTYIVIYDKLKIVNFECINILCEVEIRKKLQKQCYSSYHFNYSTLEEAINKIEKIKKTYKIYNGDLFDKHVVDMLKLEECILPYDEDENCCVCLEPTSDTTACNHGICLKCREKCLLKKMNKCPICRKTNTMNIYNNRNQLINNQQYESVSNAIYSYKKVECFTEYNDDLTTVNNADGEEENNNDIIVDTELSDGLMNDNGLIITNGLNDTNANNSSIDRLQILIYVAETVLDEEVNDISQITTEE